MRPVAEIPGLGWLDKIDPKMRIYDPWEIVGGFLRRHSTQRWLNFRLQEWDMPTEGYINSKIGKIAGKQPFQFVQIGAHDGRFEDPFAWFLENYSWQALLVEPQTELHARLSAKYEDNPNITCARAAISENGGEMTLWTATHRGYEDFGKAIASPDIEQVKKEARRCLGNYMMRLTDFSSETVPTVALAELLEVNGINPQSIDLFATDTEGFDGTIVQQLLDMGARPIAIHYEHFHVPLTAVELMDAQLQSEGYSLVKTHKDTFAHKIPD